MFRCSINGLFCAIGSPTARAFAAYRRVPRGREIGDMPRYRELLSAMRRQYSAARKLPSILPGTDGEVCRSASRPRERRGKQKGARDALHRYIQTRTSTFCPTNHSHREAPYFVVLRARDKSLIHHRAQALFAGVFDSTRLSREQASS